MPTTAAQQFTEAQIKKRLNDPRIRKIAFVSLRDSPLKYQRMKELIDEWEESDNHEREIASMTLDQKRELPITNIGLGTRIETMLDEYLHILFVNQLEVIDLKKLASRSGVSEKTIVKIRSAMHKLGFTNFGLRKKATTKRRTT